MPGSSFQIEWWWFALVVAVGAIAAAFDFEGKVLRRRLLLAVFLLWSAAALAYNAAVGTIPTLPGVVWSEGVRLVYRVLSGAVALWATYLGVSALREWWRLGDKSDDL